MSLSIGLKIHTYNYMDLIGNGKTFSLPLYQRDYSWTEENWENIWHDMVGLLSNSQEYHFMGTLFIQEKSNREFIVIDGQQRLATLNIFALAVIGKLNRLAQEGIDTESNLERAKRLRDRFIGEKNPASLFESSRLRLNNSNNDFYQDYLIQLRTPVNPKGLTKSNLLLWKCFLYFTDRLNGEAQLEDDGEAIARLLSETVALQFQFITISVEDEIKAYTVFETINARGLQLTITDLLKNYLFSLVKVSTDIELLNRHWESLLIATEYERFPEFLRSHLLCMNQEVPNQRLFTIIRDQIRSSVDVFQLLGDLEDRADLYVAISDPNHEYWFDLSDARPYIRELSLFQAPQIVPLVFAVRECFSNDDFVRVLKLLSAITFRYSVIGRLNPNILDRVYADAARAVMDRSATSPSGIFNLIKSVYVDDEMMRQEFSIFALNPRGRNRKMAKFILSKLEQDASGRACDFESDAATIEHILPEHPVEQWDEMFQPKYQISSVYRLGNLTLLESSANKEIGNLSYNKKLKAYTNSNYAITKEISQIAPEEWNLEILNRRQRQLAQRSIHIWRSDFA